MFSGREMIPLKWVRAFFGRNPLNYNECVSFYVQNEGVLMLTLDTNRNIVVAEYMGRNRVLNLNNAYHFEYEEAKDL
jgi:hypothetical protein